MHQWRSAIVVLGLVLSSSCSFIQTRGPQQDRYPPCSRTYDEPTVDLVMAGLLTAVGAGMILAGATYPSHSGGGGFGGGPDPGGVLLAVGAGPLAIAGLLFVPSAIYGFHQTDACLEADKPRPAPSL